MPQASMHRSSLIFKEIPVEVNFQDVSCKIS